MPDGQRADTAEKEPNRPMSDELALEASLSELLFKLCSPPVRQEVESEVDLLLDRYAPACGETDLAAIVLALGAPRDMPPRARLRLRLWAAAIRRRIEAAQAACDRS